MALDCYAGARNCTECARERVRLRKNAKELRLFTPTAPLEFVAIDILGNLIETKRGNRFLLVISDRYSKLVRTVPLKKISAADIALAFVHHWVFVYGPPVKLLSDNGKQFTARFFQNVCRILGTRNLFITTYHPQTNGQVERFNCTLLSALRKYLGDHPKEWDLFSDAATSQVHRTTNIAPFELVLARAPKSLALQAQPTLEEFDSSRKYYLRWQSWLLSLMRTADKSLRKEQARYKRNFDARLRKPKYDIPVESYVFVRKEQGTTEAPKHKLARVATGPFRVKRISEETVVIVDGDQEEKISRDRVELAPSPMDRTGDSESSLNQALQSLQGTQESARAQEESDPAEDEDISSEVTRVVGRGPTSGLAQRVHAPRGLAEVSEDYSPQKGEEDTNEGQSQYTSGTGDDEVRDDAPEVDDDNVRASTVTPSSMNGDPEGTSADAQEYVIEKIIDHGYEDGELMLKVRWYGYPLADATWEPIATLPTSLVTQYFQRKKLALPPQVDQAQSG